MPRVAVTELEYRKAEAVFARAASEGCECVCAPAAEGTLPAAIRAGGIRHAIIGVERYSRSLYEALSAGAVIARFGVGPGNIFPNTSYHGRQPRGLCVWHPHSPTETEGWRFFLVDADAPAEVKDVLRRFYMRYSGPAGMTEQDDMENWLYATSASRGTIARRYPFNYQMSMGAYKTNDPIPGDVSLQITDQTPRNYYRVYAQYLNGGSWDELLGRPPVRAAAE